MKKIMGYIYSDGGRSNYFKGNTGDCVCRAIAIASGRDYKDVYNSLKKAIGGSPRNGVYTNKPNFKRWMTENGFEWVSCAGIGKKIAVHFVEGELPKGKMVCSVAKHYVAVVDNIVYDTWDSRYNCFGELRRIYGYWLYKS